jgi:cytoskeletal protein CcmA (bactofilin family)
MFNKGKDGPFPPSGMPEAPLTTSRRTVAKPSSAPSILSGDLIINGTVTSEGEIQLDGQIEGDVRAGALIVGEKASVKGEVIAESVTIRGRVLGSVRGRQVQLASTARIEGDIIHSALSVESGAFFEGHCRHTSDPLNPSSDAMGSQGPSLSTPKLKMNDDRMPEPTSSGLSSPMPGSRPSPFSSTS